jgi:hypothetical protein
MHLIFGWFHERKYNIAQQLFPRIFELGGIVDEVQFEDADEVDCESPALEGLEHYLVLCDDEGLDYPRENLMCGFQQLGFVFGWVLQCQCPPV